MVFLIILERAVPKMKIEATDYGIKLRSGERDDTSGNSRNFTGHRLLPNEKGGARSYLGKDRIREPALEDQQ